MEPITVGLIVGILSAILTCLIQISCKLSKILDRFEVEDL